MGIFDLFGGGSGADVQQVSTLTPGQGSTLEAVVQQILSQFQGGQLQGITPFQGQRPGEVGFGPLQNQAFGLAGGLAPGIGAGLDLFGPSFGSFDPQQGQGLLQQGVQGIRGASQQFDPQSILSALEPGRELALRTFNRDIVPNILERFGATSGSSGALNRAFAEAGQGLSLGLSAQAAPFLFQGQQNQLNRQFAGGQALAGALGQFLVGIGRVVAVAHRNQDGSDDGQGVDFVPAGEGLIVRPRRVQRDRVGGRRCVFARAIELP